MGGGSGICDVPADVAALAAGAAGTSMPRASAEGGTGSIVPAATVAAGDKALIKVMGTAVAGFLVHVNDASGAKAGASTDRVTLTHSKKLDTAVVELMWTAPATAGTYTVNAVVLEGQAQAGQKWNVVST